MYIVNFANPDMVGHTGVIPPQLPPLKRSMRALRKDCWGGEGQGRLCARYRRSGNALIKKIADDGAAHGARRRSFVRFGQWH